MEPPDEAVTVGEKAADWIASVVGSWKFIIAQSCILVVWVILNVVELIQHWDPYPFILMNLFLSLQAAYTAPMIMMSQNRQAAKDRWFLKHDHELDANSNMMGQEILEKLKSIESKLDQNDKL